ncbi:MAG: acyltransferase [Bacteroidetes bacterium HGW-Bacteroidetes-6]|jgi:hypothetical protein|nr:MAG: acyltransferase [Bacteroidetes bacterium HGW-Bacteroidetes-6]
MENFDDIRPFRDDEMENAISKLIVEDEFVSILKYFFKENYLHYLENLKTVRKADDFQVFLIKPILYGLKAQSMSELTFSGIENIPTDKPCLFISNHRDIVLDPALLDLVLHLNNIPTVEIAIGSNLLIKPWIEVLVRINKSFVVRRDVTGRELLRSSLHLSQYIRGNITERGSYTWIAQREGRAKDGNDNTQESLLRMLALSGESKNIAESLMPLNIIPVSISYEFDPCDGLKARELWMKGTGQDFVKSPKDDLISMELGMRGQKGYVHFHFDKPITSELASIASLGIHEQSEAIAKMIDQRIFASYKLSDTQKAAYNIHFGSNKFEISESKSAELKQYFMKKLGEVGLGQNELPYIIQQYANPAANFLKTTEK